MTLEQLAGGGPMSELAYKVLSRPENLTDDERHLAHRFTRAFIVEMDKALDRDFPTFLGAGANARQE